MNRSEIKELFPEISDEQLNALMDMNGKDINAAKSAGEEALKEAREQAEALKQQVKAFEDKEASNLTREEQLEKALREVQDRQSETARGWNRMTAATAFKDLNLSEEHLASVLDAVVSEDADETAAKAAQFASIFKASTEAAVAAHVKKAQVDTPDPKGGMGNPSITKADFDSMSYTERLGLYEQSPELYQQLNS